MRTDKTQLLPTDLPEPYRADTDTESFAGADLRAVVEEDNGLYGILASPEDIPTVIQNIPSDIQDAPLLLSHTNAFPSKFDLRDVSTGQVLTQINFGSVPISATILDLRNDGTVSCFSPA